MKFINRLNHVYFLNWHFEGVSVASLIVFAVISAIVFIALLVARRVLAHWLEHFARTTLTTADDLLADIVKKTNVFFLIVLALYAGSQVLTLAPHAAEDAAVVVTIAFLCQSGLWGNRVIAYFIRQIANRQTGEGEGLATAMGALGFLSQVVLWSLVALVMLSAVHVDITALVAGLGVGGIAVALAVQNILGDLFASLSIVLDKPFGVGHFIVVDNLAGTVEHVGIKSTRVRSLSGEEIVLSNGDLLKSRIHNYKRFSERRVLFGFGVTYGTGHQNLSGIPATVRQIIEAAPHTRFDRAHFKEFADSSLNFEVVYYVLSPDYNLYMDIQQDINLQLYKRFEEQGIEFAFPTRTLYIDHPTAFDQPVERGNNRRDT